MGGLIGLFSKLFSGFSKTGLKTVLLGAGIGLASAGVSLVVINYFVSKIVDVSGDIGYGVIGIFGIAGMDKAMSIIIGSYVLKAMLSKGSLSFRKIGTK
ncbi:DUF2523 family protein [Psychrobacter urativorans]|uniref:DUF2523 family protein n=1 Tax=Psychrobacter urativorans TaxID=45610 RepID=UPI0019192EAB|nr:DUF2523 family protein [Psychrobacter urativorans]